MKYHQIEKKKRETWKSREMANVGWEGPNHIRMEEKKKKRENRTRKKKMFL